MLCRSTNSKQNPLCRLAVILLVGSLIGLLLVGQTEARSGKKSPVHLNEQTWVKLLKGEWMFDLYAPWCPACRRLEPEWQKFAEWSDDLNINVASADVTTSPALSGRFMVRGLPTIYHVKDGVFRIYNGPRELTAMINFIEEQGWKSVEPVSRWTAPDTLHMSFLAYCFQISMILRDLHNYLVDHLGFHPYLSYFIFASGTVTIGIILGFVVVFIVDLFTPAGRPQGSRQDSGRKQASGKGKRDDESINDSDDQRATKESESSQNERLRRRQKS